MSLASKASDTSYHTWEKSLTGKQNNQILGAI